MAWTPTRLRQRAEAYASASAGMNGARAALYQEVCRARDHGLSLRQIAALTGLTHTQVANITR